MQTDLTITAVGRAEWFDAWTGRFSAARVTRADARGMTVPLRLARRESVVLCVEKGPPPSAAPSTAAVEGSASPGPATKSNCLPSARSHILFFKAFGEMM